MNVAVIGVNFKQASVDIREAFALRCEELFSSVPYVLLSTCNRVEIYFSGPIHFPYERNYAFAGEECFYHLAKVTAGLDSAIVGESEIQRQVKEAYEMAVKQRSLSPDLHFLFQKSLRIGKVARSRKLCPSSHGMGDLIDRFLPRHIDRHTPVLFIGNSDINRQIIDGLLKEGWRDLSLCTRNPSAFSKVKTFSRDELDRWVEYPIVIVGAKETHLLKSVSRPIQTEYLIDLGVPRNVDPALAPMIKKGLYNIDHLIEFQKREFRSRIDTSPLELAIRTKVHDYYLTYRLKRLTWQCPQSVLRLCIPEEVLH